MVFITGVCTRRSCSDMVRRVVHGSTQAAAYRLKGYKMHHIPDLGLVAPAKLIDSSSATTTARLAGC
jgi:hypothetical protein